MESDSFEIGGYKVEAKTLPQGDMCIITVSSSALAESGLDYQIKIVTAEHISLPRAGQVRSLRTPGSDLRITGGVFCSRDQLNHIYSVLEAEDVLQMQFDYSAPKLLMHQPAGVWSGPFDVTSFTIRTPGIEGVGEVESMLRNLDVPQ
ncbi:MAG: hypothetical protein AAF871_00020 [Pseudomonadota bacterium]